MKRALLALILFLPLAACTSYYEVRDLGSNRVFYTKSVEEKKSGMIRFKDARTGNRITISQSEMKKISRDEFEKAIAGGETKAGW